MQKIIKAKNCSPLFLIRITKEIYGYDVGIYPVDYNERICSDEIVRQHFDFWLDAFIFFIKQYREFKSYADF